MKELETDILIVGGGVGGCAAALAATEAGFRAVLTEETDWIGGQLTVQAVPPDEHGWIERFGCTASYRQFRNRVRGYYRAYYPLTAEARANEFLNPGNGWVSPLCHEPRVALAVLNGMLAPRLSAAHLTLLTQHQPLGADVTGDRVRSVLFLDKSDGQHVAISARVVLDATETGDLLPLAKAEYVTGAEGRDQTGEPSAPREAQPDNTQAISVCLALDYRPGEDHTIERPEQYAFWRSFRPELEPPWPGPLLSWTALNPRTLQPIRYHFNPAGEEPIAFSGLWSFRRVLDRTNFEPRAFDSDITIVNWPMIDYLLGHIMDTSADERRRHLDSARQLSLSLIYWLQTEAPRPDGKQGWPGLRPRDDVVGTRDGLAKGPYVRESRRIKAELTVVEQHVSAAHRPGSRLGASFPDSVGIGHYRIDLHPSTGGSNFIDVEALPFQIPLGALIPVRMENLLPAAKNIGTTHITNGCYRLHPVEWNVGEAAGALAAFCLARRTSPRSVLHTESLLHDFQEVLKRRGVELAWPPDLRLEEGDPHAHALPNNDGRC